MRGRLRDFTYEFKHVVVGGDLRATTYAYTRNLPLLINVFKEPYPWEESRQLQENMLFAMSLVGKVPLANKASVVRFDGNTIHVSTEDARTIRIKFDKATIFDTENVLGLPPPKTISDTKLMVVDWFMVHNGGLHDVDVIESDGDFVQQLFFYRSDRNNFKKTKDAVAVSYMTREQLRDPEYSDTIVRFKVLELMKANGIHGPKKGMREGKQRYHPIELEIDDREIRIIEMDKFKDTSNLKFNYQSLDKIITTAPAIASDAQVMLRRLDGVR